MPDASMSETPEVVDDETDAGPVVHRYRREGVIVDHSVDEHHRHAFLPELDEPRVVPPCSGKHEAVDLAAEQQGNCELTKPGQTVVEHGVTLIGQTDLLSRMSASASQMYSRNMEKLLFYITKDGAWKLDFKDEIVSGCVITHGGSIVHPKVKELVEPGGGVDGGAKAPGASS